MAPGARAQLVVLAVHAGDPLRRDFQYRFRHPDAAARSIATLRFRILLPRIPKTRRDFSRSIAPSASFPGRCHLHDRFNLLAEEEGRVVVLGRGPGRPRISLDRQRQFLGRQSCDMKKGDRLALSLWRGAAAAVRFRPK